ncbi:hypothetical protein RND71_040513 [Anisodus tanguticus]|uniref:Uncharacterized protein n=1 Tax=Anisodus tanguticus TaxID=243964 RepID=A0AAE1QT61_9SOLA|nr:hypothetical protein RND71_040513 [Anisodus tanguticus]
MASGEGDLFCDKQMTSNLGASKRGEPEKSDKSKRSSRCYDLKGGRSSPAIDARSIPGGSANLPINSIPKKPGNRRLALVYLVLINERHPLLFHTRKRKSVLVPKRPDLGKASPMLEGLTVLLISSPDLFCARLDAISDVHSKRAIGDERDTCHNQTKKENESRWTAIAEIVTLWNCFAFYGFPEEERPRSATRNG